MEHLLCLEENSVIVLLLGNIFHNLNIWHYLNHRLELAVGDIIKEVEGLNQFQ